MDHFIYDTLKVAIGILSGFIAGYYFAKKKPSKEDIDEAMGMYRETVRRNDEDNLLFRQENNILIRENNELRLKILALEKKLFALEVKCKQNEEMQGIVYLMQEKIKALELKIRDLKTTKGHDDTK